MYVLTSLLIKELFAHDSVASQVESGMFLLLLFKEACGPPHLVKPIETKSAKNTIFVRSYKTKKKEY